MRPTSSSFMCICESVCVNMCFLCPLISSWFCGCNTEDVPKRDRVPGVSDAAALSHSHLRTDVWASTLRRHPAGLQNPPSFSLKNHINLHPIIRKKTIRVIIMILINIIIIVLIQIVSICFFIFYSYAHLTHAWWSFLYSLCVCVCLCVCVLRGRWLWMSYSCAAHWSVWTADEWSGNY